MNEINEKMIIKVLPAEGSNPEFAPDPELQKGVECYGYVLMTFNEEHEMETALTVNLSMKNITDAIILSSNEDATSMLRQAFVIAEGFVKAAKIKQDYERENMVCRIKKVLSGIDPDEEFPEDLPDDFPEDPIQLFPGDE